MEGLNWTNRKFGVLIKDGVLGLYVELNMSWVGDVVLKSLGYVPQKLSWLWSTTMADKFP